MPPGSAKFKRAAYDAALSSSAPVQRDDPPIWEITLRPYRSLGQKGFRNTMIIAGFGLLLPTLPYYFSAAGSAILPFTGAALLLLWLAFKANYRQAGLYEHLRLWHDLIALERHELTGEILRWQANPYWLKINFTQSGGPVESYLTLFGNGREVELGAFLSPKERAALKGELEVQINRLDINA